MDLSYIDGNKEIIVADGGSTDRTVLIASKFAKVIIGKKGRAEQMNTGASKAKGNILWFLHADSVVHKTSLKYIEEAIAEGNVGGGLSLYFYDYNTLFMKYISKTSNIRADIFGMYYGDQGIFVKKDVFENIGGYPQIKLMEDIEISLKLKKIGNTKMLKCPIGSSARKFKKAGQLRTHFLMHKIRILYLLGVSHNKLYKMYYKAYERK